MSLSYRVAYVFLRNLYSYKRFVVPTFLVSLVEPLFYLITFGVGMGAYMGAFGGKPYLHFLVPGVLVSAVMMSSSFECLYGTYIKIVHEKVYDSLIATPVSADEAVAGDIAWGSFRGLISGALMMTVALVMGVAPASPLAGPRPRPVHGLHRRPLRLPGHDRHVGRPELRLLQLLHGARHHARCSSSPGSSSPSTTSPAG